MNPKLLPNRSSKSVAPNAVAKLRQAIQLLHEVFGDDTPIEKAEYANSAKSPTNSNKSVMMSSQLHEKILIC
jgi:hypothetical protein